ncbi:MAG TPA: cytochrome C biosynthesis protein, partial [Sphingomicrobium sp.]|nr:cytochrome C biosynthesis protein [Sphingomicrobium sp.]
MIGFVILVLLIALSLGGLWLFGLRGAALTASAAALLLGGAGYALQGSPGLPGAPAQGTESRDVFP